ncbi:hypothetical protein D3C76_437110 [compost metagenome]
MIHLVAMHQVARVQVAVQAHHLVWGAGVDILDPFQQVAGHGLEGGPQFARDEVAFEQGLQGGVAEVVHSQRFAMLERPCRGNGVQAAEQLAEAIELVEVAGFWCMAATAGEQCEAKTLVLEQCAAVVLQRRDHGHFTVGKLGSEAVFFKDRRIAPAARSVELGDQRL